MKILVSGVAGFIASKVMNLLLKRGDEVVGIDNINDYYDLRLKYGRLKELGFSLPSNNQSDFNNNLTLLDNDCNQSNFKESNSTLLDNDSNKNKDTFNSANNCNAFIDNIPFYKVLQSKKYAKGKFIRMNLEDREKLNELFAKENFDKVINLAAQAGVRYSITNPYAYLESNLVGFLNILECCRKYGVKHLVYASSSSVYGLNAKVPYREDDKVDNPVSLYAATKKSNELMAHTYSKLYNIKMTGLRYFTVYGPWGRPDMSPMLFASAIMNDKPIKVFNNGDMIRDFTYIDDIAEGTIRALDNEPNAENCENNVPYKVYNIGCSNPVKLMDFISEIEQACGKEAKKDFLPMQPGDVYQTNADTTKLENDCGYKPHITLHEGIQKFMQWYKSEKNPLR